MLIIWPNNFSLFTASPKRPHRSAQTYLPGTPHTRISQPGRWVSVALTTCSQPSSHCFPVIWRPPMRYVPPSWWDLLWLSSEASCCHVLYATPASPNCPAEPCQLVSVRKWCRAGCLSFFLFSIFILNCILFVKIGLLFCQGQLKWVSIFLSGAIMSD